MRNNLCKCMTVISIIFIPVLFCCASTQQEQSEPRDAKGYYNRGCAYGEKGQYDQAISDFNKALEINRRDVWAYSNRGVAYYFKKDYDKSWEDVKKAQNLGYRFPPKFLEELRKASGRQS